MSFASLESRVNASVLKHLANVRLTIDGGAEIDGIFRNAPATVDVGIGMTSSAPSLTVDTANVPADPVGRTVQIANGTTYRIAAQEPDGTGLTVLILEKAS